MPYLDVDMQLKIN